MKTEKLFINSIDDISRYISLSSLLELSGYPKAGNVHRRRDFSKTRFEHFLAGIIAMQPCFQRFCERIYRKTEKSIENFSFVKLGQLYHEASAEMMRWQKGGNVLLGHILILSPLAASSAICYKLNTLSLKKYRKMLDKIISDATIEDTMYLYKAIRICNPGGLGKVEKYDVNEEGVLDQLKKDNITLKRIFELSRERDLISEEYSSNFKIIFEEGLPYFIEIFNSTKDINVAVVDTFYKLLSNHLDSLIIRKAGINKAKMVSYHAKKIIDLGGISRKKGLKLALKLDDMLQAKEGMMNPGTIADLVSGVIFLGLMSGIRF